MKTRLMSTEVAGVSDSGCYVNKARVADKFGVTVRTVDDWMRRGLLTYYKIGRTVRFKFEDLDEHLRRTCRVAGRAAA